MPLLFDMELRALRRDRAARQGAALFLYDRAFDDCMERIALLQRRFARALLIGCPNPDWPALLAACADQVEVRDPGPLFAQASHGQSIIEDAWAPDEGAFDLVVAIGTLDSVNDLSLALRLTRYGMAADGVLIGAVSGGDTVPQLRTAMRATDAVAGAAAPHVHPRIEASALASLLSEAGFANPVVDIDRVAVSYPSLERLVGDLRAMGTTSVLTARPRFIGKAAHAAASQAFADLGTEGRTTETFEILHFVGWQTK